MKQPTIAVTLDYPGPEPRLRIDELADQALRFELVPLLDRPFPHSLGATGYAEQILESLGDDRRRVDVVVSVCMAAPIGHEVARLLQLRGGGPSPVLVAIDGAPCPTQYVADVYRAMVSRWAAGVLPAGAEFGARELSDRPAEVVERMEHELYQMSLQGLGVEFGTTSAVLEIVEDYVEVSMNWLRHLVAAHNATFVPWSGEVVLVQSRDNAFDGPWPGAAATRTVRVDRGRAEMSGDPVVRRVLIEEMARGRGMLLDGQ